MKEFKEINEALDRCCQLALRQPLPGKQLVLMTDASFQAAGYAVLIEDDPNQKYTSTRKTYAPIAYGSKTYSPSQIKMSIYAKEFLAIYMAFKEFGHIFWGATKPVIIMTDSKSVSRFFQTKMIPPPLWNACDFVLQFNFTIAHIPGKMKTAADFLSRLEMDPNEKVILKIREDIPTKPIEVNIESTGIVQEETVFLDPTDRQETTEKELWKRKDEVRNAMPKEPPVLTVSCCYANDLHKDTTIVNIAQLTKPSRILIEQNSDPTLVNFEREMLGLPFDEQILLNDARYMHYSRNKSVLSSRTIFSTGSTTTTLVKSVNYRSFCPDNYLKCYYNHYMEQLVNTQEFQKWCKKSAKSITSFQLHLTSETGFVTVKYAFTINA